MSGLEYRPAETPPRPVRAHEHRPNVRGLAARVEQAVVAVLVTRTGVEPPATAPPAASHDFATDITDEVRAVGDERRVDVGDVHRRAGGLAIVVELREQLEHRRPHHRCDHIEIRRRSDTQDRSHVAHAARPESPSPDATPTLPADIAHGPTGGVCRDSRRRAIADVATVDRRANRAHDSAAVVRPPSTC